MSLAPGQTLLHYRIVGKLGEGGMGVVWRASDTKLDRDVAIKVLPDTLAADPDRLARFRREARLLASLNHPNIVTLHAMEQDAGRHFLVMELVRGRTLDRVIPDGGLPVAQLLELSIALTEALAAAHSRNITHRDLKPGNVIVDDDRCVRVLDFGLAKLVAADEAAGLLEASPATVTTGATEPGAILGTWPYMSPEQAQGESVDARSDLFSLGVLLYEMATGSRPFVGANAAQLVSSILRDAPPRVGSVRADLPPSFDAVVGRCLEKDRGQRYASAKAVLEALRSLQSGDRFRQDAGPKGPQSIAVLPFANLSGDPGDEFFSDGISEEIINALSTIDGLRVAARTSAFSFKELAVDISEIASKLRVQHVLEGSVRKAGNRIRITAHLIDVSDGCQIWSERFDRELTDIFAVQDEIATAIAGKFETAGRTEHEGPLIKIPTRNLEAYEAYLRGVHAWGQGLKLQEARDCFEHAIRLDPSFAQAWASLADCYANAAFNTQMRPHDVMPAAKEAAEKALALDDRLPYAHSAMAAWHLIYDWNWPAAEAGFERTLELKANDARTLFNYGHLYHAYVSYRLEDGLELCSRAVDVDPVASFAKLGYYADLLIMGRYEEMIPRLIEELQRTPADAHLRRILAHCYLETGRTDEAGEAIEEANRVSGRHPWALFELGVFRARTGRPEAAEAIQAELVARSRTTYVQPGVLAGIPAWLGNLDEAFGYVERAFEERDALLISLTTWPAWRAMWDDPRYARMLERLKLRNPRS